MNALFMLSLVLLAAAPEQPLFESAPIFDPALESHGHVHASCIVVCPNGDLRAVWYENGTALPAPYASGQRDKSDDVRIGGSRKPAGAADWEPAFVMADTFGVSDNNPCMVIDDQNRLWLVYATLLGMPQEAWGSALVRYHVSSNYAAPGPPRWDFEDIFVPHPTGFPEPESGNSDDLRARVHSRALESWLNEPYRSRLGWMPRAHPLILHDGTLLLPLANENAMVAAMAMTRDGGASWTMSALVPGRGVEQPTVVEFPDGAMMAFFRNDRPQHRILQSHSKDSGMTWTPLELTDLPHPGSGIEAVLLQNGNLLMVYNDTEGDPRDRLAVSISEDRGKTWPYTRHVENTPGGRFDYPSLVQAADGTLHATYSYNLETIKHVHFNEAWVRQGDPQQQ